MFYISVEPQDSNRKDVILTIKREYLELTINANGKAELYFHSYFWTEYFEALQKRDGKDASELLNCVEIKRMTKLATRPK